MFLYTHFIWLSITRQIECGANSEEMYRLLLALLPFTLAAAYLIRMTRPFTEVHSLLRWLALPLAGLILFGAYNVWLFARGIYFLKLAPCQFGELQAWHFAWVPAQTIAILVTAIAIMRVWRSAADDHEPKSSNRLK